LREVSTFIIKKEIEKICLENSFSLSSEIQEKIMQGKIVEESLQGLAVFSHIDENLKIAKAKQVPICQDTGMVVVFADIGQDVHIVDGDINEAINEGVRLAYKNGYLRKSVVKDPINRINTGDNTPAIIYYNIVPGDEIRFNILLKGFGSENMSAVKMLKPSDGIEGIVDFVIDTVKKAGPNACPPLFLGLGIGGTMEKAAMLAKEALSENNTECSEDYIQPLKESLINKINEMGIGPMGLGGKVTVLDLNIKTFPTHIAGLPVALNVGCHVNRHGEVII
jgi:fumarate hydratase subunit alpha